MSYCVTSMVGPQKYPAESFKEACQIFVEKIKTRLAAGDMSYQELETLWWLECPERAAPLYFYQVRDQCIDNDWLAEDGTWIGG